MADSPKSSLSSLRHFRFQKTKVKPYSPPDSQETVASSNGVDSSQGMESPEETAKRRHDSSQDSFDSPIGPTKGKKARILSESEPEDNGTTAGDDKSEQLPEDIMEARLNFLSGAFPHKDRMELQDALRAHDWDVGRASSAFESPKKPEPSKHTSAKSKNQKQRVKAYDAEESGSESDSDEYTGNNLVYDSDDSDDGTGTMDHGLTDDKRRVLSFFNKGTDQELACIQGCSKKKVDNILELRPFENWLDLVRKIQMSKQLSTEMLNNTTILIKMRDAVTKLMEKCQRITQKMEALVEDVTKGTTKMELTEQPRNIPEGFKLTGYQMIGLNWLVLMHKQSLNGILADEMGLGKTVQAIAFLAHLKEMGDEGPHLIVVPSSTMENWQKEFSVWCPTLKVLNYYGSQDERRHMRLQIVQNAVEFDVILTTYNMVISSTEDRVLFRKLDFHYVIFDEAHMLKNMASQRYENLMKVQASRKLLLTGTPLQNNLVELMSLLVFVMPGMFAKRKDQLKKMFSLFPRSQDDTERSRYEKDRIAHAKRIMKPFFLRRLKSEVLTDLPAKTERIMKVPMSDRQHEIYYKLVTDYKKRAQMLAEGGANGSSKSGENSGIGMLMNLRKAANHPLLLRKHFDTTKIRNMARTLKRDSSHREANESFIIEDLSVLSDFDIHKTCQTYRCIESYSLSPQMICNSGKFQLLDDILPGLKDAGDRVLMFTQFTMVLDIMEQYLRIRGHKYLRLDGSTPVQERQTMIDRYNRDSNIFIFILSTKAGGLGINLTAANTVILHDLDFNPYNDKQAEDRCHRVGQTRPVTVIRLMSEETIEEGIYSIAQEKLKLEQDVTSDEADKKKVKKDVARLLKGALNVEVSEKVIGDVQKVYTEL